MLYLMRDTLPFGRWPRGKGIWHGAPARVAGKDGFLGIRRIAVFRFKLFKRPDGGEIVSRLLMQSALSDAVSFGYPEIAGGFLFYDRVKVKQYPCYRGPSVGRNAHSRVASSQAS